MNEHISENISILKNLPPFIQAGISLKDKNWFATGGTARYFCEPTTAQEFQEALAFANTNRLPIFVLGQGANILISDDGFDGLVIRPQLKEMTIITASSPHASTQPSPEASAGKQAGPLVSSEVERSARTGIPFVSSEDQWSESRNVNIALIKAGAGITMHDLILYCLSNNIIGLEEFSGIPGTVGGSVYINLHYFQFLLAQFMVEATIIDRSTGQLQNVAPSWFNFGYDQSQLHDENHYLVDATFKLKKATDIETAYAQGRRIEIIRHRESRYPRKNTCGSFFRNFLDHEVSLMSNGKKMIYVAYYLDKIGVKGQLKVGDAIVSYQHANMIVNQGAATSTDIIMLARAMQEIVQKEFGILPQPECRLVGFKEYPLLN